MQVRTWALVGGAALLLALALVPAASRSRKRAGEPPPGTDQPTSPGRMARRAAQGGARDGAAGPADAPDAAVRTAIPDLTLVTGSCLQEEANGQVCTDYFAGPDEIEAARKKCRKGRRFARATWSDAPCNHASSHGGCWSSKQLPARIRWFYGEIHKDFQPGPMTHRVCGSYALGFLPDGTPVKHDGTFEPGAPVDDAGAEPAEP